MAPLFSITAVASILIVSFIMLPPLTSARPLQRHARQTNVTPFTADTRLFTGLLLLEETTVSSQIHTATY